MSSGTANNSKFHLEHWQVITFFLIIYDALAVNAAYFLALWLRFDCSYQSIQGDYLTVFLYFAPVYSLLSIAVFASLRLYKSIWRFASYNELLRVTVAAMLASLIHTVGITCLFRILQNGKGRMPISYYFVGMVLQFFFVLAVRFSYRFVLLLRGKRPQNGAERHEDRIMLVGAGNAGQMILRELHGAREMSGRVCCIIDDNSNKWNRYIDGVPVVGGRESILRNVEKYQIDRIMVAIPSATDRQRHDILNICKETKCRLQTVPGIYQMLNGEVGVQNLRDVELTDLLGREQVQINNEDVLRLVRGTKVLVTGGGGSIGSELCRQIAANDPEQLIIFDMYENNAYEIQQELKRRYPSLKLEVLIGSVRNTNRINYVMKQYRPDVVFHAAAHKHVPLMEDSPNEAIKNNVMGTYKTAQAAAGAGVRTFVLISTDKAVNPTNIMGASKRICEMIIQMMDRKNTGTRFVAVRFGNVLGSNGSVVPLFKKQIEAGGPVTVTDKNIIRYFMTIPEAVSLVLQAAHYAKGGEIFVLDMGDPVRIDDMARTLIRLSGLTPDVDIKIEYTGLRPGEKLYEELLMDEEGLTETENELIYIGHPIEMDDDWFEHMLGLLDRESRSETGRVRELVAMIVPTYHYLSDRNSSDPTDPGSPADGAKALSDQGAKYVAIESKRVEIASSF